MTHNEGALFAGLDVSMERTCVCLVDFSGALIRRSVCATDPRALSGVICGASADRKVRIGLEIGASSPWLVQELAKRGFEVVCLSDVSAYGTD